MNQIASTGPQLRYRLYFWLMDAALIASLIAWANALVSIVFGVEGFGLPPSIQALLGVPLWPLVTIAPIFLFLAKFMRDEYSEGLWKSSLIVLAYAAAIIPLGFFLISWASFFALGQPDAPPVFLQWASVPTNWGYAIWAAWTFYMQLFVLIFEILRWRNS